jgi:hypothetical protein
MCEPAEFIAPSDERKVRPLTKLVNIRSAYLSKAINYACGSWLGGRKPATGV